MKFCVIDCETIPCQSLPEDLTPKFDPDNVKVGNVKDPEKIQVKINLAHIEFIEALDKKMSLDPDLCEVVCFVGKHREEFPLVWLGWHILPHNLIFAAWDFITRAYLNHIPLVSFNGIGFDLPVLWHQAMKLNIPVSAQMYSDLTKKYDNRYHYDLQQILAGWDKGKWKRLDFYLRLFGIGQQVGKGSEIYGWWKAKEYDKIREHCEQDVKMTAGLFEKVAPYIVKEEK